MPVATQPAFFNFITRGRSAEQIKKRQQYIHTMKKRLHIGGNRFLLIQLFFIVPVY